MNTEKMMKENNKNEFLQKLQILTLTLSLKENNQRVASPDFYSSLYSTYIKMLENDDDQSFIDIENQSKVIDSLKRSMDFYSSDHPSFLQKIIEKMTNDDPTDFMLFQNLNNLDKDGNNLQHYCGWIVYKRENDLFVVQVDRKEKFGVGQVSYARIPLTKAPCLSELFFLKLNMQNSEDFSLFHGIKSISAGFNDDINCFPGIYDLLFSTYIKMIKNDQENFFIDKQRQPHIIQSLQRTIEIYKLTNIEDLHNIFGNLRNNDPTDFVLFPAYFHMLDPKEGGHICGLTIYKRDNEFMIMQVDKESFFESGAVSYVKAPLKNIQELSQIIFFAREFFDFKPYGILRKIEAISHKFKAIPSIKLAHQTTGNCGIIEIEATLRLILFHCKKDLFALQTCDRITPKWGKDSQYSATIEMKVRFVEAMKGTDQEWNQNFDYVLGYYLYRKKQSIKWGEAQLSIHKDYWYTTIRHLYSNDLYIVEILNSGGMIPADFDVSLKEKMIELVGKAGILLNREIKVVGLSDLYKEIRENTYELELLKGRLSFLKIPVAKEMLDYYIARIMIKNIEIKKEINRRIGIEPKESTCQMMERLPIISPPASVQSLPLSSPTSQRTTGTMVSVSNRFISMIDQVKQVSKDKNQRLVSKQVKCKVQNTLTK